VAIRDAFTQGDWMRSTTRTARLLALAAAGTLVLAACGNDDDDNGNGGNGGSASADGACDSFNALPEPEAGTPIEPVGPTEGDGTLVIGSLLPQTGNLAFLGPPEFAGVELAVQEINEAGGVLGNQVAYIEGDSGDAQQDVANPTVDRLLAANVDVIIGAASSGVSFTVIDKITSAGVVQISPANTSPDFTTYDDKGLYFRTAPSDVLQGRILAETILADGISDVGILSLQDPYGEGLAANVGRTICGQGGNVVTETVFYDPAASNFDAQVGQIASADPEAVVLIGFEESARVIQSMIGQGIGPQDKPLYLVDGNLGNALGEDLPEGVLEGTKGSLPGAEATAEFRDRLLAVDPNLQDFSYAAESYDAVITSALAAIAAESDAGEAIAAELPGVTKDGEKCTTFADCVALLEDGQDIDYDGISGPIELSDAGDPTSAVVGIYTYGPDNTLTDQVDYQPGELE
jgi:ABC-type branched-subunit amino acid transport system substrate-binding protein